MKKNIYLGLAIINGIVLYAFFILWSSVHGFDISLMLSEIMSTTLSTAIFLDAVLASLVFIVFVFFDQQKLKIPYYWLSIISIFLIGIAFAFPFYLYLRERQIERMKLDNNSTT